MKPYFRNVAIQTLAIIYACAGIYIGCGQQGGSKSAKPFPQTAALKDPKAEGSKPGGNTEKKADPGAGKDTSSAKSKKLAGDKDDDEDSSDSKGSKKKAKSDDDDDEGSLSKSICGKKFSDLDKKVQDRIRKNAGDKVDEKFLENIKITNCKTDSKGRFTFDIDFGKDGKKRPFGSGRNRDKDKDDDDDDDD